MKHSYKTIFTLTQTSTGKSIHCTEEYVNYHGLEETPYRAKDVALAVRRHGSFSTSSDTMKVHDVEGVRTIFLYGTSLWFDEEAERNEHRAVERAKYLAEVERNKVKKAIIEKLNEMSKEELEKILEKIS